MTTDIWTQGLLDGAGAKYQAIADTLEAAIADGRLRGGDRLPPQRELAARLGVDLTTVTKAYDAARQRGLIEGQGRLGSFVREPANTGFAAIPQIDTGMNMPPELADGIVARAIADGTTALLRHGSGARLQYQPPGGALQDRIVGAEWLSDGCGPTVAEQVVIAAGGQNALHAILASSFAPGDAIACGRYVYSGMKALAARLGIRLVPVADMNADSLAAALAQQPFRAVYVVPTNDNPTAVTLTADERRDIAAFVADHDLLLIEDDAYGALAETPEPTLTSLVPDHAWYVASTSKIVSPALRLAFVRAPSVAAALRLAADVHETAIMASPISAALVSHWMRSGVFTGLVAEMRRESRARCALAGQALGGIDYRAHPDGYHLWIPVGAAWTGAMLADAMRDCDLQIIPAARFAVGDAADCAVRVSLGGPANPDRILRTLRILQGHLTSPQPRGSMTV